MALEDIGEESVGLLFFYLATIVYANKGTVFI